MARPLARFKDSNGQYYQAEWQPYVLSSLVNRVTRKNSENQTNIPLTMSARDGLIDQESYFNKTVASSDLSNYTLLYQGEFAYNHSSSKGYDYGAIHRLTKLSCGAVTPLYFCFSIKDQANIDSDFLAYYFESQKWTREVASICSKGARQHGALNISVDDFFNIVIYAPPSIEEQRQIVNIASSIDNTINQMKSIVDAWELRKKGLAQKLFDQEVRFKADDGSDFPDWESKILGELGSFYGGLSGKSKEDFVDGTCPYITYKNVYLNTFATPISDDKVKITPQERQNKVKQFDVLFTQSSETFEEVGLSSVYLYDDEPYLNSFCKGFRFNNLEQIYPKFIGYLLRSDKVRHDIILMGQGISRINLRTQYLSKLNFKLPILAEQRKIAECLDAIDEVIALAKAELDKWRELKKGLLQQLFV